MVRIDYVKPLLHYTCDLIYRRLWICLFVLISI